LAPRHDSMSVPPLVTLHLPGALQMHSAGAETLSVHADTVREALQNIGGEYAVLLQHILTRNGELRPFVKVFVRNEDIRNLEGLDTPLSDGDTVTIVPSVAGG